MATIPWTHNGAITNSNIYTATPLANGDDSHPVEAVFSGDRSVQIVGAFGAGGTVIVEGSCNGTDWAQLRDPSGTLISFTAAGVRTIMEYTPYVRARVTAGDGTTAITAIFAVRKN